MKRNNPTVGKVKRLGLYAEGGPSLGLLFRSAHIANSRAIQRNWGKRVAAIRDFLDSQYDLASWYAWLWAPRAAIGDFRKASPLMFSTFHKNIFGFTSALSLTESGMFGSARPLLRHAFEGLVIAKFVSATDNEDLLQRWTKGEDIYFSNSILNKLDPRISAPLKELWKILCQFSHATVFAQQVSPYASDHPHDVELNLTYIEMLLECNYHLLSSHLITPGLTWYAREYTDRRFNVPELRAEARHLAKGFHKHWTRSCTMFCRAYRAEWKLPSRFDAVQKSRTKEELSERTSPRSSDPE